MKHTRITHEKRPSYIHEEAPVLDSIIFCLEGTKARVKYLGDRAKAKEIFAHHFPDAKYKIIPERIFYLKAEFPKLLGIIDIERGYRFTKV